MSEVEQTRHDRLAALWPVAVVVGLAVGFLWYREGNSIDARFRMSAAAVGAVLLLARAYAPGIRSVGRAVLTLIVFLWAALLVGSIAGRDLDRLATDHESRLWSHYHYYLGAKYFTELGYDGLYDQSVAVDVENNQTWLGLKQIRDLRSYELAATNFFDRRRSEDWSHERWRDFSHDVLWFQSRIAPKVEDQRTWKRILIDRGYNATPTSNTIYALLARVPLSDGGLALIGALDPLLLLLAFCWAGRVFGPLRAFSSAAWLLLFFGNEFHLIGGPLLYDYLAALILMACAVHRNRPMLAGGLLAYAAMTRVFPAFLLAGLVVWTLVAMRRDGSFPRFTNRFTRGLLGALAVLFIVGCLSGRGVKAWTEWSGNISLHSEEHRFGNKRIGLQHPFTHDFSLGVTEFRLKEWRRKTWVKQKGMWMGTALALSALWLLASWQGGKQERDPLPSLLFAMTLVFAGLVLSRYYWSVGCLFFLLGGRERDGPREAWLGAGLLLVIAAHYLGSYGLDITGPGPLPDIQVDGVDSKFGRYFMANCFLLSWLVGVLVLRLVPRAADAGESTT